MAWFKPPLAHFARSYGFLLEELGFYPNLLNPLLDNYIRPLATLLYPGASHTKHKPSELMLTHPLARSLPRHPRRTSSSEKPDRRDC